MTLRDLIGKYRKQNGMGMAAFAQKAGLSYTTVARLSGPAPGKPTEKTFKKIAHAMEITTYTLLSRLDTEERMALGNISSEYSILREAETRLSPFRKNLLEQMALSLMKADEVELEESAPKALFDTNDETGDWLVLDTPYADALNVYSDVSYKTIMKKAYCSAAVFIHEGTRFLNKYSSGFLLESGSVGGEEYALWLGFLKALLHLKEGQVVNLFTDMTHFVDIMHYLTYGWNSVGKIGKNEERYRNALLTKPSYGIGTHFVHKIVKENVRVRFWCVKSHLKAVTPASVEKQALYFRARNGIDISLGMARILCEGNERADKLATKGWNEIAENNGLIGKIPGEMFDPLPVSENVLARYRELTSALSET